MVALTPTPGQVAEISRIVARYISEQREKYAPSSVPLTAEQRAAMDGFFSWEHLGSTRLLVLGADRVTNPDFYRMLLGMGFATLPDFSLMAAITFSDVVVSHEAFSYGLLFHELVHVEQYRQLGILAFAERYVRGFLKGGDYDHIPLEVNAHTLGGRYELHPDQRFSVADEVREWLTSDKL